MREKVIIIAEAGVNHNGSLEMAKRLVEEPLMLERIISSSKHLNLKE